MMNSMTGSMKRNTYRPLRLVTYLTLALALPFSITTVLGADLYKWVDEKGNVTYQDTPPPDNVDFEKSSLDNPRVKLTGNAERNIEDAALENPVSLYTVPACDSCDLVRLYLERNAIPFAEKNVKDSIEVQNELENLNGSLTVPTLSVGKTVLDGYSRNAIEKALTDAGFPISDGNTDDAIEETTEATASDS